MPFRQYIRHGARSRSRAHHSHGTGKEAAMTQTRKLRVAITGGTSGLGLALVRRFSGAGAAIAFTARSPERVAAVSRASSGACGIVADIADKEMIYPTATQISGHLGGVDVLVNNASS